ncbi:selenium-binding protein [Ferrimonas sediminicola]|uniref:Methanethiol oxidase n=1 Tax=Ferrimonas sediminicola TaxID=2569538 RepID=A0A4U1BC59_9GAMM|nr:selenium-binding protein SBP56-related protein [Ferrimonas sediminicola]TKB48435.1 selenium-binding protein [Ferrimonas sediminicola]
MKRLMPLAALLLAAPISADETCMSPYMAKITGQEDLVYVWTVGVDGVGDGQDKLVTIDVNPDSSSYGQVIHSLSVGGRHEAHHSGFTDDRRFLWAGGLDSSQIFVFDIHSNPAKPRLHKVITDFVSASGGVIGPHTHYALPGRMLLTGLSNDRDHGGKTALVEYTNQGDYVATHWLPDDPKADVEGAAFADGYGYDVRALPRVNAMISSSFTGHDNYMAPLAEVVGSPERMARFGNSMVVWNLHTRQPQQVLEVPGAPLEIRCAWDPDHNYCFTTTALTSRLWLVARDDAGHWSASAVAEIGEAEAMPLPVDISIGSDDKVLWVNTWNDGTTRRFDITNPKAPREVYRLKVGEQVNMVSQSWDGERLYYTSSLLANWDKAEGEGDLQYFKAYRWSGTALEPLFTIDFHKQQLGSPHQMRLSAYALYGTPRGEAGPVVIE